MNASKPNFQSYSAEDFVRIADRIASGEPRTDDADSKDREIELWIRYFTSKYSLRATDLIDFDRAFSLIEERSEGFDNGLADLGFLAKFRKRVLARPQSSDAANLLRIFERSPLTYFCWRHPKDRSVANVSSNVTKNFWFGPEHFLREGKSLFELIYPDDFMRVQKEIHENVEIRKLNEYDLYYRILHSDGRVRFVHDHTHVVYDEGGNAIQSFWFVTDVTDREETRLLLDDYVRALDQSAIVQIVDRDGIIRYANDLYRQVSGDEREIVWKPVKILWGKKYHGEEFWRGLWTTVLDGKVWSWVVQNPLPKAGNDESYFAHTTITPLQNAKGEYDRFIAIKFDITPLKLAETTLRRTNARFEKILDSTSQGFWSIDQDLNIREVNASFCSMLWYAPEEIVGKNVRDFMDERNVAILDQKSSTMMTTEHRAYDLEFLTSSWNSLPVSILATTIRDEVGQFREAVAFITDATETKAFQKRLYLSSITDELTGVFNRRHFDSTLEKTVSKIADGSIDRLALAIFDIDNFKRVNDGFGHPAGDQVLRHIGSKLSGFAGRRLSVYRLWWEEFWIIGEDFDAAEMKAFMENFRLEIQDEPIDIGWKFPLRISVSAGVSWYDAASMATKTPHDLFASTDALLYLAKSSGRNNVKCQDDL